MRLHLIIAILITYCGEAPVRVQKCVPDPKITNVVMYCKQHQRGCGPIIHHDPCLGDEELDCGSCPQPYTCIQPQGWCKYVSENP